MAEMTDLELARKLAKMWIKPTIVTSVAEMPATMTAVTVTSRSYEDLTNELADLIIPFLCRIRLDEAKCMYENWNVDESIRSFDAWARNRIAALEQAAGGSTAAGSQK